MHHATARSMMELAGSAGAARRRAGFTLLELLVAVGALAFVAVGIAAIFESTGRTISAGKRVSAFTSYANLIEQQMRADFASMTRDGFLVIRNEYAGGDPQGSTPDSVPLHAEDTNPRARRIDQIMFFAKGAFTSAREPLNAEFVPRSDVARIYYGHGQHEAPSTLDTSRYMRPKLNDSDEPRVGQRRATRLGYNDPNGTNPNLYASDWTLLRHATLLRQPQTSPTVDYLRDVNSHAPFSTASISGVENFYDSDVQIALQPAASGIFRALLPLYPNASVPNPPGRVPVSIRGLELIGGPSPAFSSGIVDVATTDLTEIREVVVTADTWPGAVPPEASRGRSAGVNFWNPRGATRGEGNNDGPDGTFRVWSGATPPPPPIPFKSDDDVVRRMQAWMDDAWPSDTTQARALERDRVRCEATPVNFLGVSVNPRDALDEASRRADQMMLTSSNFLPRCTEFIVEWSFGDTYTNDPSDTNSKMVEGLGGQVIWHGMLRKTNKKQVFADQQPPDGSYVPAVYPYLDTSLGALSKVEARSITVRTNDGNTIAHPVLSALIHGENFSNIERGSQATSAEPLTSYFGYVDPTFNPDRQAAVGATASTLPDLLSPGDAATATLPWAWPKLIRVTLSLADPNDPKIERTFQFTFDVPEPKR